MEDQKIKATDMTRKIREKIARRLAGKTHAEQKAFYRQQAMKMEKKIPTLLNELGLGGGNNSNDYPWLDNQEIKPSAIRIREKQSPYKKAK